MLLAKLAKKVYTLENIAELAVSARRRLQRLGYDNVEVIWANGFEGLPEQAPFDGILVAAAPDQIPAVLIDQLKTGGRMVIPVGGRYYGQDLKLLQKDSKGKIITRSVLPVAFVPLIDQTVSDHSMPP